MANKDNNKIRLKALKKKSYANKRAAYDLDSTMNNITRRLFPAQNQPKRQEESPAKPIDYSKKIAALENKLAASQKGTSENARTREKALQKSLNQLRKTFTGQVHSLGQSTMQNDKALQAAINKKEGNKVQAEPSEEKKTEETTTPYSNYRRALERTTTEATEATETPEAPEPAPAKQIIAKIGQYVGVGSYKYKVSNIFGIRKGENSVPGREGKHSRGIDVVGTDAQGRSTNVPVAIADGVIKNITVDGSGEAYRPDAKDADGNQRPGSGGYIMDIQLPDGRVMRYMHLGKDIMLDKDNLIGKSIKRGEVLHNRDNSKGSGSQTGPHTKIAITSVGEDGKYLLDYDNIDNDPTPYLFGKA